MLFKNHLVTGASSLVFMTCAASLVASGHVFLPEGAVREAVSSGARIACSWMLDGNSAFSVYTLVCVVLFVVGVMAPDIDSQSSVVGRRIQLPIKHRTWLHSLWPIVVFVLMGVYLARPFAWLAAGWFTHLFWDSFSRQGICWFYPVPGYIRYTSGAAVKRGHWLYLYRAGSTAENVVAAISVVFAVVALTAWLASGAIPLFFHGNP